MCGVVTERGAIDCETVVLAGGAWSRLFAGSLGIKLPALNMLASVMRTEPIEGGPDIAGSGAGFSFRKRLDGGYSVALRASGVADITPDSFKLFFDFLPHLLKERHEMNLRFGSRFFEELTRPKRWAADAVTPMEKTRVLDPEPVTRSFGTARDMFAHAFPAMGAVKIAEGWGGLIDATPDAIVAALRGLGVDPTTHVARSVYDDVAGRLATLTADLTTRQIEEARKAGKLTPAMEPWAKTLSPEQLTAFLATAAVIVAPGADPARPALADGSHGLTVAQLAVCKNMGLDPKAYAEANGISAT